MKVIDLAIGFSKGIIPPKIKYKGFIYEYLKDIKDYIRLEDGHIKTLEINVEQFNDEVEIIQDIDQLTKDYNNACIELYKKLEIIEDTPREDVKLKKLKKGYYIRTRDGHIGKILSIDNEINKVFYCIKNIGYRADFQAIVKCVESEKQIIDLIQAGDYVNGHRIEEVSINKYDVKVLYYEIPSDYGYEEILAKQIKSIVTKEQFESMEYRIGE